MSCTDCCYTGDYAIYQFDVMYILFYPMWSWATGSDCEEVSFLLVEFSLSIFVAMCTFTSLMSAWNQYEKGNGYLPGIVFDASVD